MRAYLASPMLALVCLAGCATAQRDTLLAETSLASAVSLAYRTIDGVDNVKVASIRAKMAVDPAAANRDYVAYKPKIEKARAAVNSAEDVLEDADNLREAASKASGDWKNYTAYLPALVSALATIQQTIADVKGLLP